MESPAQSSPTLQDYISCHSRPSLYQQQQSSSQCIDCQKITKIDKHSSPSNSSEDEDQLIQPLHRHIAEHRKQIQSTILNLQSQIRKLKNANSAKDIVIEQLKREIQDLHTSKNLIKQQEEERLEEQQSQRRKKQVQKIRRELIENSQKPINMQRLFSMNQRSEQNYNKKIEISPKDDQDEESLLNDRKKHKNHLRDFLKTKDEKDSIQTYLQKIKKLEFHIESYEEEMSWMTNFIVSFLKMTDKFMNMFNQPVLKGHWTLRKKTKIAWRYIKQLLGWFVKQS